MPERVQVRLFALESRSLALPARDENTLTPALLARIEAIREAIRWIEVAEPLPEHVLRQIVFLGEDLARKARRRL